MTFLSFSPYIFKPHIFSLALGSIGGGGARQAGVPVAPSGASKAQPALVESHTALLAAVAPMPTETIREGEGVLVEGVAVHAPPRLRRAGAQEGQVREGGSPTGSTAQDRVPPLLPDVAVPAARTTRNASRKGGARVYGSEKKRSWRVNTGPADSLDFELCQGRQRPKALPDDSPSSRAKVVSTAIVVCHVFVC